VRPEQEPGAAGPDGAGHAHPDDPERPEPRPWIERIGLAAIAMVMSVLFAGVAVAAGTGGEWILAAMRAVGAFMTIVVGLVTLVGGR
jgi:hypothetical protein